MQFARKMDRALGFTLWEVLMVLALSAFLLYGLVPHFTSIAFPLKTRIDQANMVRIEGAAQVYRVDLGVYPHSVSDLLEAPAGMVGWDGPYLKERPLNPWNPAGGYSIDALGRAKAIP